MREPNGRVVAYCPKNQQYEAEKGRVPFRKALEERGLLDADARNALVRFLLKKSRVLPNDCLCRAFNLKSPRGASLPATAHKPHF